MTHIKFCGMTRPDDVALAGELGVYAAGFVFWEGSPRSIDVLTAARLINRLPASVMPVGVFVRPTREEIARAVEIAGIRVAQIHGTDDLGLYADGAWHLWMAASLAADDLAPTVPAGVTVLLDTHDPERHGGTGRVIDWDAAGRIASRRRVLLAGGLTPSNVAEAIRRVRPYGVDVSSGIEERPGMKSSDAMRAFVTAVHAADRAEHGAENV
jgi:phosphoribosylanthranilate isomerase